MNAHHTRETSAFRSKKVTRISSFIIAFASTNYTDYYRCHRVSPAMIPTRPIITTNRLIPILPPIMYYPEPKMTKTDFSEWACLWSSSSASSGCSSQSLNVDWNFISTYLCDTKIPKYLRFGFKQLVAICVCKLANKSHHVDPNQCLTS